MAKQTESRKYPFTDADLKQKADMLVINITRDINSFETRGVTTATLDNLNELVDIVDNFATDIELQGLQMEATENKDLVALQLKRSIRNVKGMANDVFEGKGYYYSFGFDKLNTVEDDKLCRLIKRVVRLAAKWQTVMEPGGLTTVVLQNLINLAEQFKQALENIDIAEENRDVATKDRISAGNNLYVEYARLCNIGKSLFEDENEARYNDYIIDHEQLTRKKTLLKAKKINMNKEDGFTEADAQS